MRCAFPSSSLLPSCSLSPETNPFSCLPPFFRPPLSNRCLPLQPRRRPLLVSRSIFALRLPGRTTRSSSLVSDERERRREIFPVSVSRLSRVSFKLLSFYRERALTFSLDETQSPVSVSSPSGRRRRRSPVLKRSGYFLSPLVSLSLSSLFFFFLPGSLKERIEAPFSLS